MGRTVTTQVCIMYQTFNSELAYFAIWCWVRAVGVARGYVEENIEADDMAVCN